MECFHGDRRALFPVTLASRCDPGASRARPQLPLCSWSPGEVPGQPGLLPIPSPAGLWGAMGCSALLQGLSAAPTLAAGSSRNCPSWRGDRAGLQKSQISAAVGLQGSITPHPGGRRAGTPTAGGGILVPRPWAGLDPPGTRWFSPTDFGSPPQPLLGTGRGSVWPQSLSVSVPESWRG